MQIMPKLAPCTIHDDLSNFNKQVVTYGCPQAIFLEYGRAGMPRPDLLAEVLGFNPELVVPQIKLAS